MVKIKRGSALNKVLSLLLFERRHTMAKYMYDGPVTEFGCLVMEHFKAETIAISESKAKSNLKYQFKKKYNKNAITKIDLPGKLLVIDR